MPAALRLDGGERAFMEARRTATLATLTRTGQPRLVPICFTVWDPDAADGDTVVYSPLDEKLKRSSDVRSLARVRDIIERPSVTLLFERWDEDWSRLAWLRALGTASVVEAHEELATREAVVQALRDKYRQYRAQRIDELPMIRVTVDDVVSWRAMPSVPWASSSA